MILVVRLARLEYLIPAIDANNDGRLSFDEMLGYTRGIFFHCEYIRITSFVHIFRDIIFVCGTGNPGRWRNEKWDGSTLDITISSCSGVPPRAPLRKILSRPKKSSQKIKQQAFALFPRLDGVAGLCSSTRNLIVHHIIALSFSLIAASGNDGNHRKPCGWHRNFCYAITKVPVFQCHRFSFYADVLTEMAIVVSEEHPLGW